METNNPTQIQRTQTHRDNKPNNNTQTVLRSKTKNTQTNSDKPQNISQALPQQANPNMSRLHTPSDKSKNTASSQQPRPEIHPRQVCFPFFEIKNYELLFGRQSDFFGAGVFHFGIVVHLKPADPPAESHAHLCRVVQRICACEEREQCVNCLVQSSCVRSESFRTEHC